MVEAHKQFKNGNFAQFVRDYWAVGSAFLTIIIGSSIAWSTLSAQVQANDIVNQEQQEKIEMQASAINALELKYVEDVTFIKTTLEQIKNEVK